MTDRVLECPDARVRSGEVVPIGMVGLGGLLALRSSRREVFHADSVCWALSGPVLMKPPEET